jgi:hypothetical protein
MAHLDSTVAHMKTITVRLQDERLYDRLLAHAEHERRSLNNQILWMIENGLPEPDFRGETCPDCGWRGGKHRPESRSLGAACPRYVGPPPKGKDDPQEPQP